MSLTAIELQRFMSQTKRSGSCLIWVGTVDRDGYGEFFLRRRSRRAHRVAYWHVYGDIPAGMMINHTCQKRACVEAEHLRMATPRENALRESNSVGARNARKTHCPQGHPYDRQYGGQRYCSICERAKQQRLRAKWRAEDILAC